MAYYFKTNPKVAEYLGLTGERNLTPDGNYMLWQNDMLAFGRLSEVDETCRRIGAVKLTPLQARLEQNGQACAQLPTPEDIRFIDTPEEAEEAEETEEAEEPEVEPSNTDEE